MSLPAASMMDSAKESRRLLSGVLVTLQEIALADPNTARRDAVLQIAESAASVVGDLFSLERSVLDDEQRQALFGRTLCGMRGVLSTVQVAACANPKLETVAEPTARAVAALFVASKSDAPKVGPSQSRILELVPQQVGQSEGRQPEALQEADEGTELEQSIPLTRPSRRSAQRVKIEVEVGLVSESMFYAGLSLDISTGGLFVATYNVHPVGTQVSIMLSLPDGHAVSANGVVCWVREPASGDVTPGMGIAFLTLTASELAAVEAFCRSRTPMYYDE
jgi:uncharacterized protein (TIGR02266 family)